jgi:radical SAM protein with 4Fe4S-binding SPASM domain
MGLLSKWDELVVPDDLVSFRDPAGRHLVNNPELAAWALLAEPEYAVLRSLAVGGPAPADGIGEVDRALGTLVLNWLVYLRGRRPVVREPEPELAMLYYAITDGCNLRCPYCYASSTRRLPGELETHESLDLVDQAAELGAKVLVLTGGEPMLRRDLFDVAAHARSLGMQVNMITNATLIESAAKAARVAAAFDLVTVSIDGGTEQTHERTRGKGTFARTVRALHLLNDHGVVPVINHVVSEENVDELASVGELLADIRVRQVRLMHHSALGRGADDGVSFGWGEYAKAHEFVWTNPLARNLLPDGPIAAKPCSPRGNCGLGGTEIYVNSLGNVYPCKLVTEKRHLAGNVRRTPLREIFAGPLLADLRTNSVFHGDNLADCQKCYIRAACGGGCRAYHMARSGDLKKNARSFCRVLRHQMVTSMWSAVGAGRDTLVDAGPEPFVPTLVRTGAVHPVHEDWIPESRRLLPVLSDGGCR